MALDSGSLESVRVLISHGVLANIPGENVDSLLLRAVKSLMAKGDNQETVKQVECLQVLINAGADLDYQDQEGKSAILVATMNNRLNMVKFLIGSGANHSLKNSRGDTPLSIAEKRGFSELVSFLKGLPLPKSNK